ncbi:MAG: 50S ribosomal protein L21 [candidate division Zixibacteria bacterium SM1_73]|nr:MAG: 50S ribosomal protein L21 [candidate division Zixibacteria bacterium SM1_73]
MYAIVESGGFQFNVKEGEKIRIPKLEAKPKDKITFEKVLFIGGEKPLIGAPYVKDAKVEGEVLSQGKAGKITVFKFKRRVKYRRKRGHRQEYTEIMVDKIRAPS